MKDLIIAATSGLFVEVGKVIEHMKAQQTRIADLERQLAEASAPAVEQQPVKPWEDRMEEYFAQGSVRMRTPAYFMADEIIDWRKITRAAPLAADTDKVREAILALPYNGTMSQFATKDDMMLHMQGHEDALHEAAALIASTALRAPMREIPGWQPIDTAPKDGSHILCYAPELQFVGFYGDPINKWCYMAPGVPIAATQPTHWMPLPSPPEADK